MFSRSISRLSKASFMALRIVIALLLAGSLFVQVVMGPLLLSDANAAEDPQIVKIGIPLVVLVVLSIAAVQISLICIWKLLSMVANNRVFSPAAFKFVDIVIVCCGFAAIFVFAIGVLLAPGEAVAPGVVLIVGGFGVVAIGIGLLVLVLRMLLSQAIETSQAADEMRDELVGVV